MGLGKTLQAVSLLSYLKVHKLSPGPFCEFRFCFWCENLEVYIFGIGVPDTFVFLSSINYPQWYCVL